jgi:hypothetical protein
MACPRSGERHGVVLTEFDRSAAQSFALRDLARASTIHPLILRQNRHQPAMPNPEANSGSRLDCLVEEG